MKIYMGANREQAIKPLAQFGGRLLVSYWELRRSGPGRSGGRNRQSVLRALQTATGQRWRG